MKIITETSFENFCPWSGAIRTHERICKEGKADLFEQTIEELYSDGLTETELNDLLWFEPETCYEWIGIRTYDMISEELEEAREELEEAEQRLNILENECSKKMLEAETEEEKKEIRNSYRTEHDEITEEIEEVQRSINALEEELKEA